MNEYNLSQNFGRAYKKLARSIVSIFFLLSIFDIFYSVVATPTNDIPFPNAENRVKPGKLMSKLSFPLPTNKWWTTFGLGNGDKTVHVAPYLVKASHNGLDFGYPEHQNTHHPNPEKFIIMDKAMHISVSVKEPTSYSGLLSYDDLSATLKWTNPTENSQIFVAPLIKGSPYVSIKFANLSPKINAFGQDINLYKKENKYFILEIGGGSNRWAVFASHDIEFDRIGSGEYSSKHLYNGYLRFAYLGNSGNQAETENTFYKYSRTIPVGGSVGFPENNIMTFQYNVENFGQQEELLLLCLTHHKQILRNIYFLPSFPKFRTLKGPLFPVIGNKWELVYTSEDVGFSYKKALPEETKSGIQRALEEEVPSEGGLWINENSVYFKGKKLARLARLALIACELGLHEKKTMIVNSLKSIMETFYIDRSGNHLVYDTVWGGVCSKDGISNPDADFGNGDYNDHHFHYGYYVYAAAVIIHLSDAQDRWATAWKHHTEYLLNDFANFDSENKKFITFRHMDFYEGHSWASGLYEFWDNKNQESSSESVNAYYAAYLYALATKNEQSAKIYNSLLKSEILSTQYYWQTDPDKDIYNKKFSENYAVGVLWDQKLDYSTWFGANDEFIYGIQMLPFTPVTFSMLNRTWIQKAWPTIQSRTIYSGSRIIDEWKGFMYMAGLYGVSNPPLNQYNSCQVNNIKLGIRNLKAYDDGNSKTNTLWWTALATI
ncbi:hypothetical protein BB560_003504 [Smittium megazygosporum]|uniref:glucan endo-1,3-beta-D-glucosidase n=1 Tax=Smittium megazygosporum TaxID=133381 RepID=A0A2T9ZBV5_9FUNG|nr:hypothetical protein BB560_003504 [Smittium megazygosporum]